MTPRFERAGKVVIGLLVVAGLFYCLRSLVRKGFGPFGDEQVVQLQPYAGGAPGTVALDGDDRIYFLADGTPSLAYLRTAKRSELRSWRMTPSTVVGRIPYPSEQRGYDVRIATTPRSVVVAATLALPSVENGKEYPTKVWRTDKERGTTEEIADLGSIADPFVASAADTVIYQFWDIATQSHRVLAIRDGAAQAELPGLDEAVARLEPRSKFAKADVSAMILNEGRIVLQLRIYVGDNDHVYSHHTLTMPIDGGPVVRLHGFLDGPTMSQVQIAPVKGGIAVLRASKSVAYQSRSEQHDSRIYGVSFAGVEKDIASPFASHGLLFGAGGDLYTSDCRSDVRPARCKDVVVTRLHDGRREVLGSMDWDNDFGRFVGADSHDLFFGTVGTLFRFPL